MGGNAAVGKATADEAEAIHRVLASALRGLRGQGYSDRALETAIMSAQQVSERIIQGGHVLTAKVASQIVGTVTGRCSILRSERTTAFCRRAGGVPRRVSDRAAKVRADVQHIMAIWCSDVREEQRG
jgi:hypothetical protein